MANKAPDGNLEQIIWDAMDTEVVTNAEDTTDLPREGESHKEDYIKYGDKGWPECCCVVGCKNNADGAAHVTRSNGDLCLIPMCKEHNGQRGEKLSILKSWLMRALTTRRNRR